MPEGARGRMNEATRLLLTRPGTDAARLLAALGPDAPAAILSPLVGIEPMSGAVDTRGLAGVVLTSANALAVLPPGTLPPDLPAWCVGARTAAAARALGLVAQSADGDAEALIDLVLRARTRGPLLHLHGAHTRGDVAGRLTAAGIPCHAQVVYRQVDRPLTPDARVALAGIAPLVVPLFSPRTARLLAGAGPFTAPLHVVSMSGAVRDAAAPLDARTTIVAARPDLDAMVTALRAAIERLRAV